MRRFLTAAGMLVVGCDARMQRAAESPTSYAAIIQPSKAGTVDAPASGGDPLAGVMPRKVVRNLDIGLVVKTADPFLRAIDRLRTKPAVTFRTATSLTWAALSRAVR